MTTERTVRELTVASVMSLGLVECEPDATLGEVARVMAGAGTHSVLVARTADTPEPLMWGLITDVDVMGAYAAGRLDEDAAQAAAGEIVTVAPGESLRDAARMMSEHACSHLVVADEQTRRPVGVLSSLDVIRGLAWGRRPRARATD